MNNYRAFARLILCLLFASSTLAQRAVDPFDAILENQPDKLLTYLENGGNANEMESLGSLSLLEYAVRANQLDSVNLLLRHGARPDFNKRGALFIAAKAGYLEITETLVAHGASVNPLEGRAVPLWAAMAGPHIEVAQFLLKSGAKMFPGRDTLKWAVRSGSAEFTRLAIAQNSPAKVAKLNLSDYPVPPETWEEKFTHAPLVAQTNKAEVLELLLKAHFDPNAAHGIALANAAQTGNYPVASLLLRSGADPNKGADYDEEVQVPIVLAATSGNAEIVRDLLMAHADPKVADTKGVTALIASSIRGSDDVGRCLLEAKANPNTPDKAGVTPLEHAIVGKKTGFVTLLLQYGADPNVNNGKPLLIAAQDGSFAIASALISNGAAVNPIDGQPSPLLSAIRKNHPDVVRLLLEKGATPPFGRVALAAAIESDSIELTQLVLDQKQGAPISAFDVGPAAQNSPGQKSNEVQDNWSLVALAKKSEILALLLDAGFDPNEAHGLALAKACDGERADLVNVLLNHHSDPNLVSVASTPLANAARRGRADIVRVLLLAHADPNLKDSQGTTALIAASSHGHAEIVRDLLAAHADPNLKDSQGMTALHYASPNGDVEIVKDLLAAHADPNLKDSQGKTALIAASSHGHAEIVRDLLAAHADPNLQDSQGTTALITASSNHAEIVRDLVAARMKTSRDVNAVRAFDAARAEIAKDLLAAQAEIVKDLLAADADPNLKDSQGTTALITASSNREAEIVKDLLAAHADPNLKDSQGTTALIAGSSNGEAEIVRDLLAAHADPNLKDSEGKTALLAASSPGHAQIVSDLLIARADPNVVAFDGTTPLLIASRRGYSDVVQLLVEIKADPNRANQLGDTPLMLASRFAHVDAVRALLRGGANVNVKNNIGKTALMEAAAEGSWRIVFMLLAAGADRNEKIQGKSVRQLAEENGNTDALAVLQVDKVGQSKFESIPRYFDLEPSEEPRDVRHYLLNSVIFRDSFLLKITTNTDEPLNLDADLKEELDVQTRFLFEFVKQMIERRKGEITKTMGATLSTSSTKIELGDSGKARAFNDQSAAEPNGSITIDVKLLQAAFLSSVLNDPRLELHGHSVSEILGEIEADRRNVENLAYLSHVKLNREHVSGALINLDPTDPSSPSSANAIGKAARSLGDYMPKILPAAIQYYGIVLFIIAHELGHVALGHGIRDVPCYDRELAADTFASLVLGESLSAMSIRESSVPFFAIEDKKSVSVGEYLELNRDDLKSYTGFALFFDKTYELAKFGPSSRTCIYPEPNQRLSVAATAVENVASRIEFSMTANLAQSKNLERFLNADILTRQELIDTSNTKNSFSYLAKVAMRLRSQDYDVFGSGVGKPNELFAAYGPQKNILVCVSELPGPLGDEAVKKLMLDLKPDGENVYGIDEVWIVGASPFSDYAKTAARKYQIRLVDGATLQGDLKFLADRER